MMKAKTVSLLMAGLLAGAGAYAQHSYSSPTATSDVPVQAGEASTVTNGVPNMVTSNAAGGTTVDSASGVTVQSSTTVPVDSASSTATMGAAPAAVHQGRVVPNKSSSVTSNIPVQAGEFSTWTNGVPNMSTNNPVVNDERVVLPQPDQISRIPSQAGEASTMVNGRMNWNPDDPMLRRQ